MKKFHKSQQDPNASRRVNPGVDKGYPARRVDPGWLLLSCKYLLQVDRRRVDFLGWVEDNPGSCKGSLASAYVVMSKPEESLLYKRMKSKEKTGHWLTEMVLRELIDFSLVVENKI